MAMPSSGSIGLKYCTAQANSSIALAVDGNQTGNKSLSTLSTTAGKTAPHGMREFYNYSSASLCLNPTLAEFPEDGDYCNICVCATSGLNWSAGTNDSWIDLTNSSGTGNGSFRITVDYCIHIQQGCVCVTSTQPTCYVEVRQNI